MLASAAYTEPELRAREKYFESKASPGTTIDIFPPEKFPINTHLPPTQEELAKASLGIVSSAKKAEKKGYDAAIVYNSYDPGLAAAMSTVKMPVVGAGRAALSTALMLADKLSIIAPYTAFIPMTCRAISAAGLTPKITPTIYALDIPIDTIRNRKEETRKKFVNLAKKGIADGGQIIVPLGLNSLSVHLPMDKLGLGCPVIDAVSISIRYAEMLVNLGLSQSKLAYS